MNTFEKCFNILPKWQSFAKSSHTVPKARDNFPQQTSLLHVVEITKAKGMFKTVLPTKSEVEGDQCDQIGRFIGLKATFQRL